MPTARLVGVSRLVIYPGRERAEFAVIVRSDLKGHGIGRHLMKRLVDYARTRHVDTLYGDILRENVPMVEFMRGLGFAIDDIPESEAIVRATCRLTQTENGRGGARVRPSVYRPPPRRRSARRPSSSPPRRRGAAARPP